MSEKHKKIYTVDFLLLLISGGVPFGWQVSGWPPSIVAACICWGVTLLVFLHIIWTWTEKWQMLWRGIILGAIPLVVVCSVWNPVKNQYFLQHNPPKSEPPKPALTQWYLKIDYVQCEPPLNLGQNRIYSFRVKVKINGEQIDSYPHGLIAYTGITNTLLGGDWTRLDPYANQYAVEVQAMRLNARPGQENDITLSNVLTSAGNDQPPFQTNELPVMVTNHIPLEYPLQDHHIDVVYEITNNWH